MTDKNFAKSCRNAIPEGIVLLESDGKATAHCLLPKMKI